MHVNKLSNTNFGAIRYPEGTRKEQKDFINHKIVPLLDDNMVDYLDYLKYDLYLNLSKNKRNKDVLVIQRIDRTNKKICSKSELLMENLPERIRRYNARMNRFLS